MLLETKTKLASQRADGYGYSQRRDGEDGVNVGCEPARAPVTQLSGSVTQKTEITDCCPHSVIMNVGTAHSEVNPNTRVMNSRGMWLSYILSIGLLHLVLLSIPFVSVPVVWTLTNLIHNLCMYLLLHTVKGTPFQTPDQGKARLLTHWEQMDYGVQFTASRKFLTVTPIVLYLLTSFYTKYDRVHFVVNTVSLLTVLIPKLPQLHGVRIFGINKY
ncbi:hypothetical protein OJAV_G00193480 [Oryzias javanicus]|uniref:Uncharacterized protein n=1 Tax=Oryzias javanicus TaxID=123683 RepID=A0A3S2U0K4_ORYJA|nr:hypothetical protein OJAV_G00193480 [Oryzias javanicus]